MTIANNIIGLALRNSGVNGVGQTPLAEDINDGLTLLNDMIGQWQLQRTVQVIPGTLDTFPDLTTDVTSWTPHENVLLLTLMVRLRQAYFLPPDDTMVQIATTALQTFQSNAKQFQPAPTAALVDTTANGVIFLALRAAGRINDAQGAAAASQDITDAFLLLTEMIGEWNLDRTISVVPGAIPTYPDLTTTVTQTTGINSAIMWNLSVRIRSAFGLDDNKVQAEQAVKALSLVQANNRQQEPALGFSADDTTGYGLVFLALRAAGRISDEQGVTQTSQDMTDATSMLQEMLDEWRLERTVRVIPGTLPVITDMTATLALLPGYKNAIVLNLAVRIRDAFGLPASQTQLDRAARALALIQANNLQQVAPLHGGLPTTCQQVIFLALRAAGRIDDNQSVSDTSADADAAFSLLNSMVSQWQRRRWLVPSLVDTWVVSTGAQSYTVAPGGDFNIPRPDRIESAFARFGTISSSPLYQLGVLPTSAPVGGGLWNDGDILSAAAGIGLPAWVSALPTSPPSSGYWNNAGVICDIRGPIVVSGWSYSLPVDPNALSSTPPASFIGGSWDDGGVVALRPLLVATPQMVSPNGFDYPLKIIQSREEYNHIGLKGLSTWVGSVFYDSAFPVGRLFFTAGVPISGIFELHISTKATIGGYATAADQLNLPPEYVEALTANLPLRIMALNPKGPQPTPMQIGLARAALATIRTANAQITPLNMPAEFMQGNRMGSMGSGSFVGIGLGRAFVLDQGAVL